MIGAITLVVLVYMMLRPLYYSWILGPPIDVVVYCDTEMLDSDTVRASVLYDKLAMSPLPYFLGLYQNRPPAEVQSYHAIEVRDVEFRTAGIELEEIPDGPIRQVNVFSAGQWYIAPVDEATRKNETLYVFLQ